MICNLPVPAHILAQRKLGYEEDLRRTGQIEIRNGREIVILTDSQYADMAVRFALDNKMKGLGDLMGKFATPIARVLGLDCIDKQTNQLRPESPCAKRKAWLNEKMPLK